MLEQYTKDQLWAIYNKLPQPLKEAVFSAENADHIYNTCERHNVEAISQVASYVGFVLMGLLLPSQFEKTLVSEVKLKKPIAQQVAADINRFVFYPVKEELEELHRIPADTSQQKQDIGIATPRHEGTRKTTPAPDAQGNYQDDYIVRQEQAQGESIPEDQPIEPQQQKRSDPYREAAG
jgi:hypothetical protein